MTEDNGPWPPLVVAAGQSVWIRLRDFTLTTVMWLLLVAMLNRELALFFMAQLDRFGYHALITGLGLAYHGGERDWLEFIGHLIPYLVVVFVLVMSLTTFAVHTLLSRHSALREPQPRPLSMARQAQHAALNRMAVLDDVQSTSLPGLGDEPIVDGRSLLAMLSDHDNDTLAEARRLRIAMVSVTADGQYRIERGTTLAS